MSNEISQYCMSVFDTMLVLAFNYNWNSIFIQFLVIFIVKWAITMFYKTSFIWFA